MLSRRILFVISLCLLFLPSARPVVAQSNVESCTPDTIPALDFVEVDSTAKPEDTINTFYKDLQDGNIAGAAALYSDYSLQYFKISRDAVTHQLEQLDLSQLKGEEVYIAGIHLLNERVGIARVVLMHSTDNQRVFSQDARFALGLHLEKDGWKINLGLGNNSNANLVDYLPLNFAAQTVNGLTILPQRIERYTSGIRVIFCLQNASERGVIWAANQQAAATLQFGEDSRKIVGQSSPVKPGLFSPTNFISVDGFFDSYPSTIEISGWQNTSTTDPSQPDSSSQPWSYSFKVPVPPFKTNPIVDDSAQKTVVPNGKQVDPCSLISKEEAQAVFGKHFFAPMELVQDTHQAICGYALTSNLVGDPDFYVNIFYFEDDAEGKAKFESQINEPLLPVPTGTGFAINMPDIARKLKNNIGLMIIVNHDAHHDKAALLATLAESQLP